VWHALGVSALPRDALTVSLFCYPNAAARALLECFAADDAPVVCVVPEGVATDAVHALIGASRPGAPGIHHAGALSLVVAPFVDQLAFDARLWSCALNFVRGEDSFVRAQWAARPLVWHIYPQRDDAHLVKLDAFLARYVQGLAAPAAAALRDFWHAWNAQDGAGCAAAWPALRTALPALGRHAHAWAERLAVRPDLASSLVEFVRIRL
jgi:uncharacterized repeat protein (TIGR03837 family)